MALRGILERSNLGANANARKAYAEREGGRELVAMARQLRGNQNGRPQSLRRIANDLAERGYVTPSGRHYSASAVVSMLGES
jgi:hypothetical protein